MKQIVVLLRRGPFETVRASETLRMTLGLTLGKNQVTLLYLDQGVLNLLPLQPQRINRPKVDDSLELFEVCKIRQVADQTSLDHWGLKEVRKGVEVVEHEAALALIQSADVVLPM
jgi:sulfur relay (sulfurtransferase) DsrF/TusC family protein